MYKLSDCKGETLVEVLASVLISALAIALLFNTVVVVRQMDVESDVIVAQYNACLTAAEMHGRAADSDGNLVGDIPADMNITVYHAYDDDESQDFEVEWFGGTGAWAYSIIGAVDTEEEP